MFCCAVDVSHISLPAATGVTAAVLGYRNILPAELLVVPSSAALPQWQ